MGKLTWALIGINVAVFLLVFSMPEEMMNSAFGLLSFSWGTKFEAWRLLTSMFMHASASHLFFNMIGLYFFGKILEDEVNPSWFLAIYFISGVLGSFVFMFTSTAPVVGASGAMFGVLGAAMLLNPVRRVHLYVFPLPLGIIAVTFVFMETLVAYFQPQEFSNVATMAHLAGILTGSIFAFVHSAKRAMKGLLVLAVCVLLLVFLGPIFGLITGIGALILQVLEMVIGFFLYGLANVIGLALV